MDKKQIPFFIISVIILLPILSFPLGGDQSIFLLAGKTISEGGVLYMDYIDLKPPLIYYIFALIYSITGESLIGIRLFELTVHIFTIISVLFTFKRLNIPTNLISFTIVIYSLLVTTINFDQTFQCESFAAPTFIWIVYLLIKSERSEKYIITCLLAGILTSFKYTMGIIVLVPMVYVFIERIILKELILAFVFGFVGFLLGLIIGSFPLFIPEVREYFAIVLENTMKYSGSPPIGIFLIKHIIKSTGQFFGDNFSLLFTTLLAAGFYKTITWQDDRKGERIILELSSIAIIVLIFSVFVERKIIPYHFTRMYLPASILIAFSFSGIFEKLTQKFKWNLVKRLIAFSILVLGISFSPISRWVKLLPGFYYYVVDKERYEYIYEYEISHEDMKMITFQKVAGEINNASKGNESAIVVTMGAPHINLLFNKNIRISSFSTSVYYFSEYSNKTWKNEFFNEVRRADWLVIDSGDVFPLVNNHHKTSYESLKEHREIMNFLEKYFSDYKVIDDYHILRRI